jgi:hypothetical protein
VIDVADEHIASIFRVEEEAEPEQETSMKAAGKQGV